MENDVIEQARSEGRPVLRVYNKIDLLTERSSTQELLEGLKAGSSSDLDPVFPVSCKPASRDEASLSGLDSGIDRLLEGLKATLRSLTEAEALEGSEGPGRWEETLGANHRQRQLLLEAQTYLERFASRTDEMTDEVDVDLDLAVAAEELRAAADCMAKITGKGDVGDIEEVLGVVFEKFCVGK